MAKLKGPLFSLGASGAIGEAIVYFPWKGLNVAREYVIPSNPKTDPQKKQRGYLTTMVDLVHSHQASDTHPLTAKDIFALALLGSTYPTPRTWFNQAIKDGIDQLVKGLREALFTSMVVTPTTDKLTVEIWSLGIAPTEGKFWYGPSKTALIHSVPSTPVGGSNAAEISPLVTGTKYFIQFRPTEPAPILGTRSGIYYGVPL